MTSSQKKTVKTLKKTYESVEIVQTKQKGKPLSLIINGLVKIGISNNPVPQFMIKSINQHLNVLAHQNINL